MTELESFMNTLKAIRADLDKIKGHMDDHMGIDPDSVNWGHVGTAQHVLEQLEETIYFLGLN